MRTNFSITSSVGYKMVIPIALILLIICTVTLYVEQSHADNTSSQCKIGIGYGKERIKGFNVLASRVNCGLGKSCSSGYRCCRVGVTVWCCPKNLKCDYDIDSDWAQCK